MRKTHKTALGALIVIVAICVTWYSCRQKPPQVAVAPPAPDAALAVAPVATPDAAATPAETPKTEKEPAAGAKEPRPRAGARGARAAREEPQPSPPKEVAQAPAPLPDAAPVAPPAAPDAAAPAEEIPKLNMPPRKLARVAIRHHSQMGPSFHLTDVTYLLDGKPIFERHDDKSGQLEKLREFDALDQNIDSGMHTLTVQLAYRASTFGVFKYAEGYRFKVRSSFNFTTNPGRLTEVAVNAYEKGNVSTPLEERPAVKFDVKFTDRSR